MLRRTLISARQRLLPLVATMLLLLLSVPVSSSAGTDVHTLLGEWHGESLCQVKPSACNDEVVVYTISDPRPDPLRVKVQGDKIVEGERVTMGVDDWQYEPKTGTLTLKVPVGTWQVVFTGSHGDGTLVLNDGTLFRKMQLTKAK
jgi:hypothetical protein